MQVHESPTGAKSALAGLATAALSLALFDYLYVNSEQRFASCAKIVTASTGIGVVLALFATRNVTRRRSRRYVLVGLLVAASLELAFGGFVAMFGDMGDV
jgi:drug/metabolite transporter superfamily protein YnfA